ncbi:MAG: sucrose-6-phosphate hydrolase, partial [Paenibacillus sp.]|nr:sucrose-6-phosphate hydrolase [Paenibacillus sp.]
MTVSNQKPNHKQLLAIADDKVNKAREIASRDPHRLNYHIMAPANWINDPNGLIQFKGSYHVFYQHHPFGVEWGPMHWGHATSPDLVHWEHQPIALAPSETYDHGGCFSGSAVEHEDKMYLFYTGVVYDGAIHTSNRHNRKEVQCMAVSNDGRTFEKHPASPILSNPPADGSKDFRDPKVWKYGNQWYMVVGSTKNGVGKVLIYESLDLVHWSYKGVALESSGTEGYMWECPDLFPL